MSSNRRLDEVLLIGVPLPILTYAAPARRRKPPLWPTFVFILYLLVIPYALAYAIYYPAYHFWSAGPTLHAHAVNYYALIRSTSFRLALILTLVLVNTLPLLPLLYFSPRPAAPRLGLRKPSISALACMIFALGGIAFSHISASILESAHLHSPTLARFAQLILQACHDAPISCLLLVGLVAPISEELLFRGYIQTRLVRRLGPFLGILITSLAFGLFHRDPYQGGFAFAIGLFMGAIAYRAQSILPSILIHIVVNTTSVLIIFTQTSTTFHSLPFTIAAIFIFPASIYLLFKLPPSTPAPLLARTTRASSQSIQRPGGRGYLP